MIDWTKHDREQRESLERVSSCGQRLNVAQMVNTLAKRHGEKELPGMAVYGVIRLMQNNGAASATMTL